MPVTSRRNANRRELGMTVIGSGYGKGKSSSSSVRKNNLTYWLRKTSHGKGVPRMAELPSRLYTVFFLNPLALSWIEVLVILLWVLLWVLLSQFGIVVLPVIDNTVPGIITAAVGFLASFILSNALSRRGNNIKNIKSLESAVTNTMNGVQSHMAWSVWKSKPKIEIRWHNNHNFVFQKVEAIRVLYEIKQLLAAIVPAQRNVKRAASEPNNPFDPEKLPLEPHLIAHVLADYNYTIRPDPIVILQNMAWERINALEKAGGLYALDNTLYSKFNADNVDAAGNVAIDSEARTPFVFQVFYYFFLAILIAYLPFWLIPLYPGYFVLIAAPLALVFLTSVVRLADRIPEVFVSSDENRYSGYNLVGDVYASGSNIHAIYLQIKRTLVDVGAIDKPKPDEDEALPPNEGGSDDGQAESAPAPPAVDGVPAVAPSTGPPPIPSLDGPPAQPSVETTQSPFRSWAQ